MMADLLCLLLGHTTFRPLHTDAVACSENPHAGAKNRVLAQRSGAANASESYIAHSPKPL
jgi:hypothetical protein